VVTIIIAAAAGRSIVVLSILTVPAALELIRRYHRSRIEFSSRVDWSGPKCREVYFMVIFLRCVTCRSFLDTSS
jgi:hypothetical protein